MAEWIARGGADPQPPQPPRGPDTTLRELIDVLAVGQSEQVGPATLTLLSVERYRDGFLAQFRLLQEYTSPEDPTSLGFPELVCEASDERGGRYTAWPNGGSGGGGRGLLHWRLAYRYAPALDPTARELRLSIPTGRWRHRGPPGQPSAPDEVVDGPWTFLIALRRPHPKVARLAGRVWKRPGAAQYGLRHDRDLCRCVGDAQLVSNSSITYASARSSANVWVDQKGGLTREVVHTGQMTCLSRLSVRKHAADGRSNMAECRA